MIYLHKEAYCLMTYRGDCGMEETVWNSDDWEAPFIVDCACGESDCKARHVDWTKDARKMDFIPPKGMRCFTRINGETILITT